MWKFIYTVISIIIIIPMLFIRSKIYEWFYNDVIRIIPEFIWKMLYKVGDGGQTRSDEEMVYFLRKGANHNHALCELELAEFYQRNGDLSAAGEWKKRAKNHGIESDEDKQRRHQKHLDNVCTIAGVLAEGVATVVGVKKLMRSNEE